MSTQFMRTATDVLVQLTNASAAASSCDECVHHSDQDIKITTSQALNSLQNLYHELNHTVNEVNTQYRLENAPNRK